MDLTVSEYAKMAQVSAQSVYSRIRKGKIQAHKIDGVMYIKQDIKQNTTSTKTKQSIIDNILKQKLKYAKQDRKRLKGENKELKKRLQQLEHRIENSDTRIIKQQDQINEIMSRFFQLIPKPDVVHEAEIIKKKKKKKKRG